MHSAQFNKGNAFSVQDREAYGLEGLLPHKVEDLDQQVCTGRREGSG